MKAGQLLSNGALALTLALAGLAQTAAAAEPRERDGQGDRSGWQQRRNDDGGASRGRGFDRSSAERSDAGRSRSEWRAQPEQRARPAPVTPTAPAQVDTTVRSRGFETTVRNREGAVQDGSRREWADRDQNRQDRGDRAWQDRGTGRDRDARPTATAPAATESWRANRDDRARQERMREDRVREDRAREDRARQERWRADRDDHDRNRGDSRWRDNRGWQRDGNRDWGHRDAGHRDWDRNGWRRDNRYDWQGYRDRHRSTYRLGRYSAPYYNYSYRRIGIGFTLGSLFFGSRYWINDPWSYRLPDVYGPYRWVRYYDDVLLVNVYTGDVVDVIYDFFW